MTDGDRRNEKFVLNGESLLRCSRFNTKINPNKIDLRNHAAKRTASRTRTVNCFFFFFEHETKVILSTRAASSFDQ